MNVTEKMALDCGVKIATPFMDTYYMPIVNYDFIIIDTRSKYAEGHYDYFLDVFVLIKEELEKRNVAIIQFTSDNSPQIPAHKSYINSNRKQEAYLISKAKLIVSCENLSLYMAAIFNVKSIGLYSIFDYKNAQPVWNKDSQIVLQSHRHGNNPTYGQLVEKPKTINLISPYEIAFNILKSLNIPNDLDKYELVNIGDDYNQKIIEVVPDFINNEEFLKDRQINLRLDYMTNLSLQVFNYWINNRKVNIVTDKDVNVNILGPVAKNIQLLTIMVTDAISENFLKLCKSMGLQIKLICNNKEKLNEYRFKFLDWDVQEEKVSELKFSELKNLKPDSKFVSSKIIISKGKHYSCKANFFANKSIDNSAETVVLSTQFEEELEYFKIYNERQKPTFGSPNP